MLPKYSQRVIDKALNARAVGELPPGVYINLVLHDDWCPTLMTGDGTLCCCEPDLEIVSMEEYLRRVKGMPHEDR